MRITFKHSLTHELKEYFYILVHFKDTMNLRSVVWNPLYILAYSINHKNIIAKANEIWKPLEKEVTDAFIKLDLKLPKKNIICYVHGISCEGWYNVDTDDIHVRLSKCSSGEFAGTIVHELAHLATWRNGKDYLEREDIVDKYLARQPLLGIIIKIGDNPQSKT